MVTTICPYENSFLKFTYIIILTTIIILIFLLLVLWWRNKVGHLNTVFQKIFCQDNQLGKFYQFSEQNNL